MEGRIYRLRKKSRTNYFSPADYEAAGKLIGIVKQYDGLVNTVEIETSSPTDIQPVVLAVLKHNGFSVKKVITGNKKLKLSIPGDVANRSKVQQLVASMKNDRIDVVDFENYSYPVGTSVKGVKVPLEGYTKKQAESGDTGLVTIVRNNNDVAEASEEKSSPNWLLIGGIAVVGLIAILAVIKMFKK